MFRKILMSALVLGALAATVGTGAYAAFQDTETATGTVTAGSVDVGDIANFVFVPGDTGCPGPIGDGDFCVASGQVDYDGNLTATIQLSVADSDAGCFTSTVTPNTPQAVDDPTDFVAFTITTTLTGGNACQGASNQVTLTATATES